MISCLSATKWYVFAVLLGSLVAAAPTSAAKTIHVPVDQPTIQAGINATVNGDTVLVSPGTDLENINFNGKAITVTSATGPTVFTQSNNCGISLAVGASCTVNVTFTPVERDRRMGHCLLD